MAEGLGEFNTKAFGRRLRAQRNLIGLSEDYMAQQLGMELESYRQLERGHNKPSLNKLIRIKSILRVSIDYLVDGDATEEDEARKIIIENIEGCFSVCTNYHLECMSGIVQHFVKSIVGKGPTDK